MKTCPSCGAQVDDNSLFCTECGKQIPQDDVCPHCGASVNTVDSFCQNCGESQKECTNTETIVYEEEEPKNGLKQYLPYVIGGVILLGIIGYCSSNDDGDNASIIATVDSVTVEKSMTPEQEIRAKKDFIEVFYQGFDHNDSYIKKYVSPKALQILKDEYDFECEDSDCLGTWLFVYPNGTDCDFSTVVSRNISEQNENDYLVEIKYKDAYYGIIEYDVLLTVIKDGDTYKIDGIKEKGFTTDVDSNSSSDSSNLDWLQGHWIYEQGSYKGHFIIQGDKIIQYSSMNPEHYEATFRIEDGEIKARLVDGMDLAVKIDFTNQRIDYGDGCWMHKVSSSSDDYSSSSSNTSSSKTFANEQYVTMYLVNRTFRSNDGITIKLDGNLRMYIDGDYAGVVSVLRYNSTSALLRYGGGAYGDGRITVQIVGDKLQLIDPTDGSVYHQR